MGGGFIDNRWTDELIDRWMKLSEARRGSTSELGTGAGGT